MDAGSEVEITPLDREGFPQIAEWLSNRDVNRLLTAEWRNRAVDATVIAIAVRNRRNRLFGMKFSGQLCGLVGLSEFSEMDKSAMIWYALGRTELGGKGITTRAVEMACEVGFKQLGLVCIWATVLDGNSASLRVLDKNGFKIAGRLRQVERVDGVQLDRIYLDKLHE